MKNKPILIAELGINSAGDFNKAKLMISKALASGATYCKGQLYDPIKLLGSKSPYLEEATKAQFTKQQHEDLAKFGNSIGIKYFVSVFDVRDVEWASRFGLMKIASRMNRSSSFVAAVEKCKLPTFMSVQPDVDIRVPERFKLLWCVPKYPTSKEEILKYPYDNFGLSTHCPDITATLEAIKLGARIIEHHVCIDKNDIGCDISSSITFEDFKKLRLSL